jgi:AraC-like DNA-binding protein
MPRHEAKPHPWIRVWVDRYWAIERDFSGIGGITVTPDRFVELVFCADTMTVVAGGRRAPLPAVSVIGLLDAPIRLEASGVVRCAAVRFHAWARGKLTSSPRGARGVEDAGESFAELAAIVVPALQRGDWPSIWQALDAALVPRLNARLGRPEIAARHFVGASPPRAGEVAAAQGIGRRQVERDVRAATRSSPKQLAGLARFHRVRDALWAEPQTDLAALAAENGYADQAHLAREFKRFAGCTARQFLAESARLRAWQRDEQEAGARDVAILQDERERGDLRSRT